MDKNRQSIAYKKEYPLFFQINSFLLFNKETRQVFKNLSGLKFYKSKNQEAISNRFNKFLFKVSLA